MSSIEQVGENTQCIDVQEMTKMVAVAIIKEDMVSHHMSSHKSRFQKHKVEDEPRH